MDADNLPSSPAETGETPVAAPVALQTAEEKALTSHLTNVVLPEAEDGEGSGSSVEQEVSEIKLPKTLKATLDLIFEGQNYQPKDALGAKRKDLGLERLRAHAHALSQGTPAPAILGADHTKLTAAHSDHAEDLHLTLLRRTDRIVDERLKSDAATIDSLKAQLAALTKK